MMNKRFFGRKLLLKNVPIIIAKRFSFGTICAITFLTSTINIFFDFRNLILT